MYDYLIVGAGLFGSIFAHEATKRGHKCLVIDRRAHIGGNCYTEEIDGIHVHRYGAHIFRTSRKDIWEYISNFADFNHFVNSPIAYSHGRLFNLPFNMNTFYALWGTQTPDEAKAIIEKQRSEISWEPRNLEEHAIRLVGRDIYETLIKEYTEKQWGRPCSKLPSSILRRLPIRFTYDNNYFNAKYQGVPIGGYTQLFRNLLTSCEVRLNTDYLTDRTIFNRLSRRIIYTGAIDEFFCYGDGPLEYRSLYFKEQRLEKPNAQGVAVMNHIDANIPYTRTIEHKHFEFGEQSFTILTEEYPLEWTIGSEPYYPIENAENQKRYRLYLKNSPKAGKVIFAGRLGSYRYTDMQDTVISALELTQKELQ